MRCSLVMLSLLLAIGLSRFSMAAEPYVLHVPLGLEKKRVRIPAENPMTGAKVQLGKQLFFDPRLSRDDTISCASCHHPEHGWSNGRQFATGVDGQVGGRNAPTIINTGYINGRSLRFTQNLMFWDGRALDLEGQALGPIQNPIEMDLSLDELEEKLNKLAGYREQFQTVFGSGVTRDGIAKAIAAFERTVLSGDAPIDRYLAGDPNALSVQARRGWELFLSGKKTNCTACHEHTRGNFTDGAFHNIGVGMDKENPDLGRYGETKMDGDRGAFKTPTLRDITRTAPYMHDGSEKTLEDVVEYYVKGGVRNAQLDEEMRPLKMTDEEKRDLVTFLKEALASSKYPDFEPPELPE